jgi:tetratricopeptide (TPR) repeat protein
MMLATQLSALEADGLILLARLVPEVEYLFRHALVQDAAYQSLLKSQRLGLHRAVGESLEALNPGALASPELAPVLARHFAEAGDRRRGLHYYSVAGRLAAESYANAEAARYFGLALEMSEGLPAEAATVADLFLRRGRALEHSAQDPAAIANYQEMEAWAKAQGDQPARLAAMSARATIYVRPSVLQNQSLGYDLSQQALALARELGDRRAEAEVLWNLCQHFLALWKMDEAVNYGEQALKIARELGLTERVAYVLTDLAKVYPQIERGEDGRAALAEARALWRKLGTLNMLADNLASAAFTHTLGGEYDEAVANADEAQQISRAIGNIWNESYSRITVDMVYFERGEVGRAIEVAEDCQRLSELAGFAEGITQSGFDLAFMFGSMGAVPRALEAARQQLALARVRSNVENAMPQIEGLIAYLLIRAGELAQAQAAYDAIPIGKEPGELKQQYILNYIFFTLIQAELDLAAGSHQKAIGPLEELIAFVRQNRVRLLLPDALHVRARVLRAAGRAEAARLALEDARLEAESLGSRRTLWPILAELGELAAGRGDQPAALKLRRQAAEVIDYITEHAGSANLAESFVHQPAVQEVLRALGR